MGRYVAVDELESRVTQAQFNKVVTGSGLVSGSSDATNFGEGIIGRAEDMVDGYVGKIFYTPLPPSSLLKEWVLRFAEYEFYKKGSGDNVQTKYKDSYNEALAQIKDCLKGELRPEGWIQRRRPGNSISITSERPYFTPRFRGSANSDLF